MKKSLTMALLAISLAGCSSITGKRVAPDGSDLSIRSHRFFWASEGVDFSLTDTNGLTVRLGVQKSNPDAQALYNVARGAAEGAAAAASPAP